MSIPNIKLNNGLLMPVLGLGTWQGPPGQEHEVKQAVKDAISLGYRHFDCAHVYENEHFIGEAIQEKIADGTVKREDLFIVSKLWNTAHRPDLVEPNIKQTLKDLQLDYLDLYLIHWPQALKEESGLHPVDPATAQDLLSDAHFNDTWKAMEKLVARKLTKSIGISNFNSEQVTELLSVAKIIPVTNQIECHPYLNQKKLHAFCEAKGITITAYSPLGSPQRPWAQAGDPDAFKDPEILKIAQKYNKTVAQILLRYNIQLGNIVIPKSSNPARLRENSNIFDFALSPEDMAFIDTFDCNGRLFPHDTSSHSPLYPFKPHVEY